MKLYRFVTVSFACALFALTGCMNNNNKNNDGQGSGNSQESNNGQDATTYNKTRDDMNADSTNTGSSSDRRVPQDPVERQTKGNAASQ